VTTAGGDIYVSGFYWGTASFGGTTLKSLGKGAYNLNRYIAKLDSNGNARWAQAILQQEPSELFFEASIFASNNGSLFVSGPFQGTYKLGAETLTATSSPLGGVTTSRDGFVTELNAATGAFIKSWRFGGGASDQPNAIASDGAGGVLVLRFAAAAASVSMQTAQSSAEVSAAAIGNSTLLLDAATVDQLLAEPNSENTWIRKSRVKVLV
jgi:hypothetical protein